MGRDGIWPEIEIEIEILGKYFKDRPKDPISTLAMLWLQHKHNPTSPVSNASY